MTGGQCAWHHGPEALWSQLDKGLLRRLLPPWGLQCMPFQANSQNLESVLVAMGERPMAVALQKSCGNVRTSASTKPSQDSGTGTMVGAEIGAMLELLGITWDMSACMSATRAG
jgi:hypothetical protein